MRLLRTFLLLFLFSGSVSAQSSGLIVYHQHHQDTSAFRLMEIGTDIRVIYELTDHTEADVNGILRKAETDHLELDSGIVISYSAIRSIGYARDDEYVLQRYKGLSVVALAGGIMSSVFIVYEIVSGKAAKNKDEMLRAEAGAIAAYAAAVAFYFASDDKYRMYNTGKHKKFAFVTGDDYVRMKRKQFMKDIGVRISK